MPTEPWDEFSERLRDIETAEVAPDIISPFLALPGLRGFWPTSAAGTAGQAIDLQGLGNHLTRNNDVDFGYENLAPYCDYDGTNQWHSITDAASANAFDIVGTEGYILGTKQGLTLGGWFRFDDDPPAAFEHLIGKWATLANRSYELIRLAGTQLRFRVWDGAAITFATTTITTTLATWYHCVGKFDTPSGDLSVYLNGVEFTTAAAVVSINPGDADFTIAATAVPGNYMDGQASLCWICAESLSSGIIQANYQQTRSAFGV